MTTLWVALAVAGVTAAMFGIGVLIGHAIARYGNRL